MIPSKRVAHEFLRPSSEKPLIDPSIKTRIPLSIRQPAVEKIFCMLESKYPKDEAITESIKLEDQIYALSRQKADYKIKFASLLLRLKNPDLVSHPISSRKIINLNYEEVK